MKSLKELSVTDKIKIAGILISAFVGLLGITLIYLKPNVVVIQSDPEIINQTVTVYKNVTVTVIETIYNITTVGIHFQTNVTVEYSNGTIVNLTIP